MGNSPDQIHHYSFGLKIAAISSRKLPDANEGNVKNNYQYQGAYNEFDDDISLNDFELRNYDPQIGRWIQQDPYQQFASPYVGMGNDPVNNIDPSGGIDIPCPGIPQLELFFMKAGEMLEKGLTTLSRVSPWLSVGLNTAKIGDDVYNRSVQFQFLQRQLLGNVTLQAGDEQHGGEEGKLIAQSRENELVTHPEDGTHGKSGNIKGWENAKENVLKSMMQDLIMQTTSSNKQMRDVGLAMMNRFFNNTGGTFTDPRLDLAVYEDKNFRGFAKNIYARFNEELKRVGGDVTKLNTFKVNNPAFNRTANYTDGLGITIHGVSYVEVHISKFELDSKSGNYHLELQFDLYDNFGLDSDDITGSWWNLFDYHNDARLKAWWLLQHKFDHIPLRTHVTEHFSADLNIHDTYKIHK